MTQPKIKPVQPPKFGQHWDLLPGGKVIEFHPSLKKKKGKEKNEGEKKERKKNFIQVLIIAL